MEGSNMKEYEVAISFTYTADNPIEAAKQFIANIPLSSWYVTVTDTEIEKEYLIDSEDWSIESEEQWG